MAELKHINVAVKIVFTIVKPGRKFDVVAARATRLKAREKEKIAKTLRLVSYFNGANK